LKSRGITGQQGLNYRKGKLRVSRHVHNVQGFLYGVPFEIIFTSTHEHWLPKDSMSKVGKVQQFEGIDFSKLLCTDLSFLIVLLFLMKADTTSGDTISE